MAQIMYERKNWLVIVADAQNITSVLIDALVWIGSYGLFVASIYQVVS